MKYRFLAAALLCFFGVSAVGAEVVTVTPVTNVPTGVNNIVENQLTNGWSIVTNRYGIGEILPGGPSYAEAPNGLNSMPDGSGVNFGSGTFYAACSHVGQGSGEGEDQTPSTIFLGLDQFGSRPEGLAGIKLNQIKTLKYYTYVSKNPSRQQDGSSPDNWDSWSAGWLYPSQPVMLQVTVGHPDPGPLSTLYSRLQFTLRPSNMTYLRGDTKNEDALGLWYEITVIDGGVVPENSPTWMLHYAGSGIPDVHDVGNWTTLCGTSYAPFGYATTYGEMYLLPTSTDYDTANYKYSVGYKSPGWRDTTSPIGWQNTTGTGKPLNFVLGARRSVLKWPNDTVATSWAHMESINARAQMDYFTLGVDLNGDGDDADAGEKLTYNFEPAADDPRPVVTYVSQKDLRRGGVNRIFTGIKDANKYNNLFKVSGRVTTTGNLAGNPWFELDDGSGLAQPTRVYYSRIFQIDDLFPEVDKFMEAWGFLEIPRWPYTVGTPTITLPYVLWSDTSHCRQLD